MISTLINRINMCFFVLLTTPVQANDIFAQVYGNSFEATLTQTGSNNDIDLIVNSDNNAVVINQTGDSHSAYLNLSGNYANSIDLTQSSLTGNTFSLTQFCNNISGCSVIISQQ